MRVVNTIKHAHAVSGGSARRFAFTSLTYKSRVPRAYLLFLAGFLTGFGASRNFHVLSMRQILLR